MGLKIRFFKKLSNKCPGDVGAADADCILGTAALEGRSAMAPGGRYQ